MGRPVFFSVSSKDIASAEAIAGRFPGDVIYLYTRVGVDGVEFWDEIERAELNQARGVAIFWSRNFLSSPSCLKELDLVSSLLSVGQIRHVSILRLDDTPLAPDNNFSSDEELAAFQQLGTLLVRFRALTLPFDPDKAFHMVDRLVREVTASTTPIFPRPQVVELLRTSAKAGDFAYRPAMWISGFNGYGRRTAIREFYRSLNGNATAAEFDITELALPLPLLLMIEERALGAEKQRLIKLQTELADRPIGEVTSRLADAIRAVARQQRYVILRQTRVHEERALPPEWIIDVIKLLEVDKAPILFLTVQVPPPDEFVIASQNKLGTMRMNALGMLESESFVRAIITSVGNRQLAWDSEIIERIYKGANGTPELITKIVMLASTLPSLENLDEVIGAETAEFTATMTHLARWAFAQLKHDDERRALLILDDLILASADDISTFLATDRPMAQILGALERVGLVERDDGDLYRLSPMFSRRLNANLITPELTRWRNEAVRRFISSPIEINADGHGMVSIQARITAALQSGAEVPEGVSQFVNAANYLQSGIRAYRANRMDIAYKLLSEAFAKRSAFADTARREAARFYGLVCARQGDEQGTAAALAILDSHFQSKPVAHFIRGFGAEFAKNFDSAIDHYEKARKADEDLKQTVREGLTIRYLVNCLLRKNHPNFKRVTELADRAARLNNNAFVLTMHARAYLHQFFKDTYLNDSELDQCWTRYQIALDRLENDPGAAAFYFQVRAEESMLDPEQGASDAIGWMRKACANSDRFDQKLRLWQYMARSGETTDRIAMMREIEEFAKSHFAVAQRERNKMIDYYAQALGMNGPFKKFQLDQVFPADVEGYNFSAHSRYGKNPFNQNFTGDDISMD